MYEGENLVSCSTRQGEIIKTIVLQSFHNKEITSDTRMTEILPIPLKKATDLDITKPFKTLISSTYSSADQPLDCSDAISELQKLRNAATKNPDRSEASLDAMMKYYDQLVSLEMKIPATEVQIPFKWKDAFDKGSIFGGRISLTVHSLRYEKVSVDGNTLPVTNVPLPH